MSLAGPWPVVTFGRAKFRWTPTPDRVKQYVQLMVRSFADSDKPAWWQGRLTKFEEVERGVWHVEVYEEYSG